MGNDSLPAPRPYWISANLDFDALPEGLRVAVLAVINPAYEELVLQAPTALERASGVTLVHLLWLEIIDQVALGHSAPDAATPADDDRQKTIDRLLRLVGAKQKTANFLHRLKEFRLRPRDPFSGSGLPSGVN